MGGTLARYATAGEQVVVVTATRGEEGEIHNYEDSESIDLGEQRAVEMASALEVLGVKHHHFLGYRDSGMMGTGANGHPDAFWNADTLEAAGRLVRLVRRYRPEVMTVYDPYGGYGHPDHIQVHRVGMLAYFGAPDVGRFPLEAGEEAWEVAKLYWSTFPRSVVRRMQQLRAERGDITEAEAAVEPAAGSRDEDITLWVDTARWAEAKIGAVLAHRSQIPADSWFHEMTDEQRQRFGSLEPFTLIFSRAGLAAPETDLFAGLR